MRTRRTHLCWLLVLATALTARAAEPPAWQAPGADFRRKLHVEEYAGGPRTVSTLVFTPAGEEGEGGSFKLFDPRGRERPVEVLDRRGSRTTLFFNTTTPGEDLWLYFVKAAAPPTPVAPVSGLIHRVKRFTGRPVATPAEFEQLWADATAVQGGRFVDRVFASLNPFGDNPNALHRYDGFLRLKQPGEYAFCLATTDASFLLIDGKQVVAWPGKHPVNAGLNGQIRGTVTLEAGDHRFAFLHANLSDTSYAVAAVVPPGEKQHVIIPAEWFTDAVYALVGRLERRGKGEAADFLWENVYQVNYLSRELYHLSFEAAKWWGADGNRYEWEFGDGTSVSGTAPKVEHFYSQRGTYRVTLSVTGKGLGNSRVTQEIVVDFRRGQDENDDRRAAQEIRQAMRQAETVGIQAEGWPTLALHALNYYQDDLAEQFTPPLLKHANAVPLPEVYGVFFRLAMALQQIHERYDLAEQCFKEVLRRAPGADHQAMARLHYAGLLLHCLDRPADARPLLAAVKAAELPNPHEQRLLAIYLADAALVLDGVAAADRLYQAIAPVLPLVAENKLDRRLMAQQKGRYFHLQNLVANGNYRDALTDFDQFEWENPTERLDPALALLRAEALAGNQQPRKAAVCLARVLHAEVGDNFRPQLRLALARFYLKFNDLVRAQSQLKLLREETPFAREEVEAQKLLDQIQKQIESGKK